MQFFKINNSENWSISSNQGVVQIKPNSSKSKIVHIQTFVCSCPDFRAFMSRLSCVHVQTFVRSCPDFRAFMFRLSCVHVQTFVRSCSDFRAFMSRLSCVRQTFVRSCSDFRAFMSRLSCVRQTFVRSCSDFFSFFDVSRLCNFERTTPPSCVHLRSGHTCFRLGLQPGKNSHASWNSPDRSTQHPFVIHYSKK